MNDKIPRRMVYKQEREEENTENYTIRSCIMRALIIPRVLK
jgi:hypothetical protein